MTETPSRIPKSSFIEKIFISLLFLGISFSICYWAIAKYDVSSDYKAAGDAQYYIKMSKMEFQDVYKPYRYRVLMPSLVYGLNKCLNLDNFLSKYYENVEEKRIQLNFGIINILSITFTGFLLFYYCIHLGFTKWESLTGALLFFTSFFVVNYYSIPMVDSLAAFFIIAGFYAVLRNSTLGLVLTFLFGVFAKETTFLILLLIMLEEKRIFSKKILYCLPGILLYFLFVNIFRYSEGWTLSRTLFDRTFLSSYVRTFYNSFNLYFVIEAVQTFMFLWVLFLYGLFRYRKPKFIKLALWLLLLPIVSAPIAGTPVVGRVTFFLFPIVIPLSLFVLKDIFGKDNVPDL